MKILIYDDTESDVMFLQEYINIFFQNKCFQYSIDICESTKFLFKNINNYDLVFLDIELADENGIEIGLEIRKINRKVKIIIASNYSKYLIDGYKIHADRYFIKPFTQFDFDLEFENIVNNYFYDCQGFYDEKISIKKIYLKNILYIDFYNRKSRIHLLNSKILDTPYPLKYWEDFISLNLFSKPHKSFIVNFKNISGFTKTDVVLINEELIPLSRGFKKDFESKYLDFLHLGL